VRLGWVRVVGEGDLAVLVFGDVGVMTWASHWILMCVLLVGLVGCCRFEERGRIVVMRRRRRCSRIAAVEN